MELSMKEVFTICFSIICCYLESFYKLIWPLKRRNIQGQRVLVTGSGQGIGRELAIEFGRLGAVVILWDINLKGIETTAEDLKYLGTEVHAYKCDVSSADDIRNTAARVRADVGGVDVLVNNAGVLNGGPLLEMREEDIKKTFNVNALAQFWTVREFLPGMIENGYGHILNIASASASSGTAYLVDYSSSKAAVLVFSEGLAEELFLLGHTGVKVTVVCPAFVDTGLCKHPKDRINRLLSPKETALAAIDGMLRGEFLVHIPKSLWLGLKFSQLLPEKAHMRLKTSLNLGIDPQYKASDRTMVPDKVKAPDQTEMDNHLQVPFSHKDPQPCIQIS